MPRDNCHADICLFPERMTALSVFTLCKQDFHDCMIEAKAINTFGHNILLMGTRDLTVGPRSVKKG